MNYTNQIPDQQIGLGHMSKILQDFNLIIGEQQGLLLDLRSIVNKFSSYYNVTEQDESVKYVPAEGLIGKYSESLSFLNDNNTLLKTLLKYLSESI